MTSTSIQHILTKLHESGIKSGREAYVILMLGQGGELRAGDLASGMPYGLSPHEVNCLTAVMRKKGLISSRSADYKSYHSLTESGRAAFATLTS